MAITPIFPVAVADVTAGREECVLKRADVSSLMDNRVCQS